jgi:hypothetical protein
MITITFLIAVFVFGALIAVLIRNEELDLDHERFDTQTRRESLESSTATPEPETARRRPRLPPKAA